MFPSGRSKHLPKKIKFQNRVNCLSVNHHIDSQRIPNKKRQRFSPPPPLGQISELGRQYFWVRNPKIVDLALANYVFSHSFYFLNFLRASMEPMFVNAKYCIRMQYTLINVNLIELHAVYVLEVRIHLVNHNQCMNL